MSEIVAVIDNVWGGLDEGLEAGYRWVLEEHPAETVAQAVREMANEDRPWRPKAPEIAARVHRLLAVQVNDRRLHDLIDRQRELVVKT